MVTGIGSVGTWGSCIGTAELVDPESLALETCIDDHVGCLAAAGALEDLEHLGRGA